MSFRESLKQHRLARNLTQEALAERAAMSRRTIQALEAGTNKPYRDTAARLAEALALDAADRAAFLAAAAPAPRRPPRWGPPPPPAGGGAAVGGGGGLRGGGGRGWRGPGRAAATPPPPARPPK